jgi:hypothetical protein
MRSATTLAAIIASLAIAAPAMASGGVNSGGVNSGGVNSGGVNSGGSTTTAAPTSTATQISSFSATGGYRPGDLNVGAIWVSYGIKNSSQTSPANVLVSLTEQNVSTGVVEWGFADNPLTVAANSTYSSGTIDNDWTPLATTYLVTLTVKDAQSHAVIDTRQATVTTGQVKTG